MSATFSSSIWVFVIVILWWLLVVIILIWWLLFFLLLLSILLLLLLLLSRWLRIWLCLSLRSSNGILCCNIFILGTSFKQEVCGHFLVLVTCKISLSSSVFWESKRCESLNCFHLLRRDLNRTWRWLLWSLLLLLSSHWIMSHYQVH